MTSRQARQIADNARQIPTLAADIRLDIASRRCVKDCMVSSVESCLADAERLAATQPEAALERLRKGAQYAYEEIAEITEIAAPNHH